MDSRTQRLRREAVRAGSEAAFAAYGRAMLAVDGEGDDDVPMGARSPGPPAEDAFSITRGRGFRLTFANGWSVSVQWGPGNYISEEGQRYTDWDGPRRALDPGGSGVWQSRDAEVAVFQPDDSFLPLSGDNVAGWVNADEVAELICTVAGFARDCPVPPARAAVCWVLGLNVLDASS